MVDKVWKAFERQVARFFGVRRTGPMQPKGANDIQHDLLHVQCRYRKSWAIINQWKETKKYSKDKIPVMAIRDKGSKGFWLLVHSSDLVAVANQRMKAKIDQISIIK